MIELETDYLVVGAGAMGMAFSDEILNHNPSDRIVLVDRHAKPGGHWNDAYRFVFLHQPAAFYGVNSLTLGSGGSALASGSEVLTYYERVMDRLLATGRLEHFPMCESHGDGHFSSRLDPTRSYQVKVRKKTVDATYMNVQVPSIRKPPYPVAEGIAVAPPNALVRRGEARSSYVVIGAGKTGMDAALFLLDQGVDPDRITWIMSQDAWLLNRACIQPHNVIDMVLSVPVESFSKANTLEEVYLDLEAQGLMLRLDPDISPTKFRCATVSLEELAKLRGIEKVVRMGRVVRIDPKAIVLEGGSLPTDGDALHIDCTADGLAKREIRPVFEGSKITLQSLSMCQQVFSAAVIGYVESRYREDAEKNALCRVVPHPEYARDFAAAIEATSANAELWGQAFGGWLRKSRLSFAHHPPLHRVVWSRLKLQRKLPIARERMRAMFEQQAPTEGRRAQ